MSLINMSAAAVCASITYLVITEQVVPSPSKKNCICYLNFQEFWIITLRNHI